MWYPECKNSVICQLFLLQIIAALIKFNMQSCYYESKLYMQPHCRLNVLLYANAKQNNIFAYFILNSSDYI